MRSFCEVCMLMRMFMNRMGIDEVEADMFSLNDQGGERRMYD